MREYTLRPSCERLNCASWLALSNELTVDRIPGVLRLRYSEGWLAVVSHTKSYVLQVRGWYTML